jgi:hypothetical protein
MDKIQTNPIFSLHKSAMLMRPFHVEMENISI